MDNADLLSRLSAATEGSAEFDREVLLACGWREQPAYIRWLAPNHTGYTSSGAPRPTRSLDDITQMIEGAGYKCYGFDASYLPVRGWANGTAHYSGATPALAMCHAFLRAREAGR